MISITILGFILVSIAIAINASIANYEANDDIATAGNRASSTLSRITADLRTATAVSVSEPTTQCTMINAAGSDITYSYNASDDTIYLITNDSSTDDDYVLCENVTAVTITKTTAFDDLMVEYVRSVQITIAITVGSYTNTSSAAVVIRKNL